MSIHAGHRQRFRERFKKEGLDNFNDHEVLELLLYHCIPRQDTNAIAHRLLDHFGSFANVLEASSGELVNVLGVGESAAAYLNLLMETIRRYNIREIERKEDTILDSIQKCGNYLKPLYDGRQYETVYMLCLDAKCKLLSCQKLGEGSINSAAIPIRRIVETAMNLNATSIVIAHNHPSGIALPSDEDVSTTKRLAVALEAVEILLADHLVFADGDYVSMRISGLYNPQECVVI